ncbi:MAG: winged helix-turn-helix transcriptional regulator [Deltaproteobacteria bacterium]|nr:winged helix-turn-helix transcriptional regulator [Deltaproteobacteria bacterium]
MLDALRRIVRFLRLADREVEARCRVSAAQLFVLQSLIDAPATSLAELAARSMTDQSSVSTVVARLVERNLVAKRPSRVDRRRAELRITPAGQRIVAKAPRLPQSRIIEAFEALPAARRNELVRALSGFAEAIGADEVAPRMFFEDEPPVARRRRRA